MLTPDYIKKQPDKLVDLFLELEDNILHDLVERLEKNIRVTDTAEYQLKVLLDMGYEAEDIQKYISEYVDLAAEEVETLLKEVSKVSYERDQELYKVGGKELVDLEYNLPVLEQIEAISKQTKESFKNLTNTIGLVDRQGAVKTTTDYYRDKLSQGVLEVSSGLYTKEEVVRKVVQEMGDRGIVSIDFESGRKYNIESHVRTTVTTGINQITGYMSEYNADLLGQDLMEITAHAGARPSHADWQGQIVSRSGRDGYLTLDDIGYGDAGGFKGSNCRHDWYPYFEGISERNYTKKDLQELDNPDFVYQGKKYTMYEATQKQRYIERQIGASKRKLVGYQAGNLENEFLSESIKLRRLRDEYKQFSKKANLKMSHNRHMKYKFDRAVAQKARWTEYRNR